MNLERTLMKILVPVTYIGMIAVNALANIIPINNVTTGGVSDAYGNLFAPAGVTFSIWGVIYLLLALYTIYQSGLFGKKPDAKKQKLFDGIAPYFIMSSIANMLWIFSWHYDLIPITVLLMGVILYCLIKIADIVRTSAVPVKDTLLVRAPFGVYFGWITVATIANITTYLVSIGWDGLGIAPDIWTVLILLVGTGIGIVRMRYDRNVYYGLTLVWAFAGILLKHLSDDGFQATYMNIITTVIVCLVALSVSVAKVATLSQTKKK